VAGLSAEAENAERVGVGWTARPRRGWKRLTAVVPSSGVGVLLRVIQLGPLVVLAVLWVVMSFASPYFLTTLNITNLLQATAVVAILALGQLLIILIGGIDLSAAAVMALVTVVGAKVTHGVSSDGAIVIAAMLATGLLAGLTNGLLVEKVRLASPFVVTLGTLSIAQGIAYVVSGGATITGLPSIVDQLGSGRVGEIPISALVVAALALLALALTARMPWGRWIYAVGGNRDAAVRSGIPVKAVSISVFVLGGLAAGVAGIFTAGLTDAGAPSQSFTVELDAISAVVIGGAALYGGRGTVFGTMVGALILGTIHNGLNLLNVNTSWEPIVLGTVLILAVGMDLARGQLETRLRLAQARRQGAVVGPGDEALGGAGG
jgi:ribose transport system permease protein